MLAAHSSARHRRWMVVDSLIWAAERIAELEARLAACESVAERWRALGDIDVCSADEFEWGYVDRAQQCADELEAAIRGEENDEQAG